VSEQPYAKVAKVRKGSQRNFLKFFRDFCVRYSTPMSTPRTTLDSVLPDWPQAERLTGRARFAGDAS